MTCRNEAGIDWNLLLTRQSQAIHSDISDSHRWCNRSLLQNHCVVFKNVSQLLTLPWFRLFCADMILCSSRLCDEATEKWVGGQMAYRSPRTVSLSVSHTYWANSSFSRPLLPSFCRWWPAQVRMCDCRRSRLSTSIFVTLRVHTASMGEAAVQVKLLISSSGLIYRRGTAQKPLQYNSFSFYRAHFVTVIPP